MLTKLEENEPELASSQEDEVSNELKVIARLDCKKISKKITDCFGTIERLGN